MNLKTYRQKEKLTLEQLADRVGCHFTMISKMESWNRAASPLLCVKIERATGGEVGREELRPDLAELFGGVK